MQVYTNSKRDSLKTFLLFAFVLIIAYLPVSSFLFFLKNDAFNGYFPPKFFMSESIYSGHLPLWNPYINFGLPQYGDMSSGYWSPVTWLVAATTGYNAYSFTVELLIYLLIAGFGMYKLCRFYCISKEVSIIAGVSYMCCGYMTGHLQHFNWISGAAFLPWSLWSYHRLKDQLSLKHILLAALCLYMLAASAHPGISIGAIYLILAYSIFIYFSDKNVAPASRFSSYLKNNLFLIIALGVLSFGMIAGYLDILPHITRGEKIQGDAALVNPFSFQSASSALLPLSIVKNDNWFHTDLSMRNIYCGLTVLLFFVFSLFKQKNRLQRFFLVAGSVFLLLSLGGIVKMFSIKYIPLIGYVRMDGEFVIFFLLCFILTAAFSIDAFFKNSSSTFSAGIKRIYHFTELALGICIVAGFYKMAATHDSFVYAFKNISSQPGIASKLKSLIDAVSFYDALWLQGLLQLFLLWGVKYCLVKKDSQLLLKVCITDLVIATLLNIPFSGVGKASVAEVQAVLNKSPKGIIIPSMKPVNAYDSISAYESGLVGNWSFYNKEPGVKRFAFYPVELNQSKFVFADSNSIAASKPCLFLENDAGGNRIHIDAYSGNCIVVSVQPTEKDRLVFQQNHYAHWRYEDGKQNHPAERYRDVFLSAPVNPGNQKITFVFEPAFIKKAMLVSCIAFIIFLFVLTAIYLRSFFPSSHRQ